MEQIMLTVNPQLVEKIISKSTILLIAKMRPKIQTPFKVFIYEAKGKCVHKETVKQGDGINLDITDRKINKFYEGKGKVVAEFICDSLLSNCHSSNADIAEKLCGIKIEDIIKIANGKELWGYHISDLVVYEKPKELNYFLKPCICPNMPYCPSCPVGYVYISESEAESYRAFGECNTEWICLNTVKSAPKKFCYIEREFGLDEKI